MTDSGKARSALTEWYAGNKIFAFVQPMGQRNGNIFLFRVTTNHDKTGIIHPVRVVNGKAIVGTPAQRRMVVSGPPPTPVMRPFTRESPVERKTHLMPRTLESTGWTGTEEELADREG